MRKIGESVLKVLRDEPVGRAIWMCDVEEPLLCGLIYKNIKKRGYLTGDFKKEKVMIGFDKVIDALGMKDFVDNSDLLM